MLARTASGGARTSPGLAAAAPADLRLVSPDAVPRLQRAAGNAAARRRPATLRGPRAVARAAPGLFAPPSGPVGVPGLPPPGTAPPPLPRIPGGLGTLRWVGTAAATAESVLAGTGAAAAGATTVVEGTVAVGGVALGEGALVVAAETALVAGGAAAATGEAAAIAVAGTAIAEGATVVVAGTATATATGATAGAGAAGVAGGAALITPVGWVVIGVIVVGLAVGATVYLVMRYHEPETHARAPLAGTGRPGKGSMAPAPRHAPGAPGGTPVSDPRPTGPALAPGADGAGPMETPGVAIGPPMIAPGIAGAPMETGRPSDLPSWSNATIDWDHVYDGHWDGTPLARGANPRRVGNNTMFNGLTKEQIQRVVRNAYAAVDKKLETQNERIRVRGQADGWLVEFWVNKATREIETAYPIFP
jgi:hypothetical protein